MEDEREMTMRPEGCALTTWDQYIQTGFLGYARRNTVLLESCSQYQRKTFSRQARRGAVSVKLTFVRGGLSKKFLNIAMCILSFSPGFFF